MHASTDADIQLCRVGSLSSVNSLARDPMVAEASFRTPKKVVSAPVLLAQSVECGLRQVLSHSRCQGFVGSALLADPMMLAGRQVCF